MTARQERHARGRTLAILRFVAIGCRVDTLDIHAHHGSTLLVDGKRVAVRVTSLYQKLHVVTVRGKTYRYVYKTAHWSLHQRSERRAFPQFWCLVRLDAPEQSLIVPARVIGRTRLAVELQAEPVKPRTSGERRRRKNRSRLWAYVGAWELVRGRQRRRAA